jgi:DNA-binding SARP family transcriptional activator
MVMDELWRSLEAEAPHASLDMALSRLRKLLELPDAVRWVDGQLVLDAPWDWTDVAAFGTRGRA